MSLSERLKVAEQARRGSSGLTPGAPISPSAMVDLTEPIAPVLDLTDRYDDISSGPAPGAGASGEFDETMPVADDRTTGTPCPRCGGTTRLDLIDQVHQTASLGCTSCFYMFKVDQPH
jgi:hypothetical protein